MLNTIWLGGLGAPVSPSPVAPGPQLYSINELPANARSYNSRILHARTPADPSTQSAKKGLVPFGNVSYGWLIRATGKYLIFHSTPTSRSTESKTVTGLTKRRGNSQNLSES